MTVTLSGAGFITTSQAQWNGAALSTTYASSASITAQIPASDLTSTGTAAVTVTNPAPGGGTSSALTFTINPPPNPVPAISALSPGGALTGSASLVVTVTGTGFISASQVAWNGSALTTTYVSGTSLTAQIPASDLTSDGTASVTVTNPAPGGGTSSALTFTISSVPNLVPTISLISPAAAAAGSSALTLAVTGTNFVASSQVLWNGTPLTTTFVSSTSLTAQIPSEDLASVGSASASVMSPAPGGGTSGSLTFTISAASMNLTVLPVEGNDLAWNASQQKIYVAVPASASTNPSTITVVDPVAGTVGSSTSLASEAYGFAISSDDSYLYAAVNGGATIQRFALPGLTPDIQWTLGTDPLFGTQYLIGDMEVQPGTPATLAVSYGDYGVGQVALFDNGVQRGSAAGDTSTGGSLLWKPDGSEFFAGWGVGSDCPYWTSTSDTNLEVLSVSQSGLTETAQYGSAFQTEGVHLHLDDKTGYIYDDWGEIVNPANGMPTGSYGLSAPYGTYFPGLLSVANPATRRYFVLQEISAAGGAFQIQSFDMDNLTLLSTVQIPNAVGYPTNFILWGQSGLAFVTQGAPGGPDGQLYILDGTFVNPSGALDTTAGTALTPVPTLTAVSPLSATVGAAGTNVTITGRDFVGSPTVYWNGNPLQATLVSSTEVQVTIPSADLTAPSAAAITAANSGSAGFVSNALPFTVDPAPPAGTQVTEYDTGGNGLVWDANAGKIYVSMPGVQGNEGNTIASIDPANGTVTTTGFIGSNPANLAISSDGASLFAALYGQNAIEQLALPGLQAGNSWNLGADSYYGSSISFNGPYYALDLEPAPGAPQTLAVTLAYPGSISPSSAAVRIYDGATPRSTDLQSTLYPYSSLQWAGDSSMLYAVDQEEPQDFLVLGVGSSGATLSQPYNSLLSGYSPNIRYDEGTGLVYTDAGQVINPSTGTIAGSYAASGMVVPDSTLNAVFILGQTSAQSGTQNYTVEVFDQSNYTALDSITIDNVIGTPSAFIRWGTNGLAFTTRVGQPDNFYGGGPGRLYVISGTFVADASRAHVTGGAQVHPVHRTWGDLPSPRKAAGVSFHMRP